MNNMVCLIGRITRDIELEKVEDKDIARITLAVQRHEKNEEGIYEIDFIDVVLNGMLATHTNEYCKRGDLICIKGKIQSTRMASGYTMEIVADKISFLASNKNN